MRRRQAALTNEHALNELSQVNNELANLQREMARKNVELERLNLQKNRLLGIAAHDLRTPLAGIHSYSEFLETEAWDVLSAEQREFIVAIKELSEFTLAMVTDVLDVAAIEAGKLELNRQPTDLTELVRRSVTLNGHLAARKKIAVELAPFSGIPTVPVDARKMEQVLNNLIGNAVKFSHPDTVVQVRLTRAGGLITVAVQDHGQGIPAAEVDKLFKPFSKTSVRSTAGERSTGLGLAIVRSIVEGHGGRLSLESTVGLGSTFTFTLPEDDRPRAHESFRALRRRSSGA
jgi:two-component system, OmpR family, sensor kinase